MNVNKTCLVMMMGLALAGIGWGQTPARSAETGATAITQPSQRLKLSFVVPGIIKHVAVKEGDLVKVGEVLLSEDDRMEQKQLEALMLDAQSPNAIDAAKAEAAAKKVDYERVKRMHETKVASDQELEASRLAWEIAEIKIKQAMMESQQKKLEAGKQQIKVELMKLVSPIDGVVEKLIVGLGEAVDPQKPEGACVVVKNDPLWVEIRDLSTAQVKQLKLGQMLPVRYDDEKEWQEAKIIYFSPVADAGSDTQLVRLELPNPGNRASGMHMAVKLPQTVANLGEK
jgi:RND family efflux transporter MFP subunit